MKISISKFHRGKINGIARFIGAKKLFRAAGGHKVIKADLLESISARRQLFVAAGFSLVAGQANECGSYRYILRGRC